MHDSASSRAGGRERSLRHEWSRTFAAMLAVVLVVAVATLVGVWSLVDQVRGTARQLHRESVALAALHVAVVSHEEQAHLLLSAEPVDQIAFVRQQDEIGRLFVQAAKVFPVSYGLRQGVVDAERSWQSGLTAYGLWGEQVGALSGNHSRDNPTFGAAADHTTALLNGLDGPSLSAMDRGLAHGVELEHILVAGLAGLFGLALALTVYFSRRMARDFLAPVATMHQGVLEFQAGEYGHPIAVARRDELGELTQAFNAMASALRDTHTALTLRATHDSLTGLPNRASLTERLTASFTPGAERRSQQESVLFIDVDDFKEVNDSLGHDGGDALLVQLAARLERCVRPGDIVTRLGGDEFAIVVVEEDGVNAEAIAERILGALRAPFIVNGAQLIVSVSIGVAHRRPDTADAAELLRRADFAMYMAKGDGKGRYQLFDAQVHDTMVGRSALKTELAMATASGQLFLEYQPVFQLSTGKPLGVEALVRWRHPTLGVLSPADFISLAEETGDIDAIGCWVLEQATSQVATWRRTIPDCADLWVSVNLSSYQLANPEGLAAIGRILADPTSQAEHVVLEITETALATEVDGGIASLNTLKRLGVRLAIDDFGCGFSSLSSLASLPVDILKIDRSFVSGDPSSSTSSVAILEGIVGLAERLSLSVIAEGIETSEQLNLLGRLGCQMGQGFFLGRPVPPPALEALLVSARPPLLVATPT